MNTPNPLIPQGTKPAGGKSTVRIAVLTILAVHLALIGGMLIQGCSKDTTKAKTDDPNVPSIAEQTNDRGPLYPESTSNGFQPTGGGVSNATPAPIASSTTSTVPPLGSPIGSPAITPAASTSTLPAAIPTTTFSNPPIKDIATPVTTGTATEHVIASGDTFGKLAHKYHVSLKALEAANPGVSSKSLKVGQKIQIPAPVASATPTAAGADASAAASPVAAEGRDYTVKQGDVLARIAKTHNTSVKAIQELNHLKSTNIRAGQKLKLPAAKATAPTPETAPVGTAAGAI